MGASNCYNILYINDLDFRLAFLASCFAGFAF